MADLLLELVQDRFGAAPPWVLERVYKADHEQIKRWVKSLLVAKRPRRGVRPALTPSAVRFRPAFFRFPGRAAPGDEARHAAERLHQEE